MLENRQAFTCLSSVGEHFFGVLRQSPDITRHMTNTDSTPFQDIVASIRLRENERGSEIGADSIGS
jgi:hypothetical protein